MSANKAKDTFKQMISLCYEENFPELHKELVSLESEIKKDKDRYEVAMQELLTIIPLFTDEFPPDTFSELEKLYEEYLENNE